MIETASGARAALRNHAAALSSRYRSRSGIPVALSAAERAAYLATRFPATYAGALSAWRMVEARGGLPAPRSVLDAGAGPGTASLALADVVAPGRVTLLERDAGWRDTALRLATAMGHAADFVPGSLEAALPGGAHDAVVAAYALNELPADAQVAAALRLWAATGHMLLVIEPGTPAGFATVRAVRAAIVAQGGHVLAPCTHDAPCPVAGDDWCHFAVEVQRSSLHRAAKGGTLAHETEKTSFVALARHPAGAGDSGRIVRRPIRAKGHVHLDACRAGRIERVTFSRRQGERYRQARDCAWGDLLPDASED